MGNHCEDVMQYCHPERAKSHGIQTGPLQRRILKVDPLSSHLHFHWLDNMVRGATGVQYFKLTTYFLAEPDNQYLGQCRHAPLSPTSVNYVAVLPPHFMHSVGHGDAWDAKNLHHKVEFRDFLNLNWIQNILLVSGDYSPNKNTFNILYWLYIDEISMTFYTFIYDIQHMFCRFISPCALS